MIWCQMQWRIISDRRRESLAQTGHTLFNLLYLRAHLSTRMNMEKHSGCSLWVAEAGVFVCVCEGDCDCLWFIIWNILTQSKMFCFLKKVMSFFQQRCCEWNKNDSEHIYMVLFVNHFILNLLFCKILLQWGCFYILLCTLMQICEA